MENKIYQLTDIIDATGVSIVTMVGHIGDGKYPLKSGNCFSLITEKGHLSCVNFFHENLTELLKNKAVTYPIKVLPLGERHCMLVDPRIPKDWLNQRFCSICTPSSFLPLAQQAERLIDLQTGRITEQTIVDGDKVFILRKVQSSLPAGYIYAPWIVGPEKKGWLQNIWNRLKLWWQYRNGKPSLMSKYKDKKINSKYYGTVTLDKL